MAYHADPLLPVGEVIARWRPRRSSVAAAAFARETVAAVRPASAVRARTLLWTCSRLAGFGEAVGLALEPGVLLHPSTIERFVRVGLGAAPLVRLRTVRTNLRFVARRVGVASAPDPAPLSRSRAKEPYEPAEIDALLALAAAQPTEGRRQRLTALLCLGLGAGLTGADMRLLRGAEVRRRHGGVVVVVAGSRARVVPVLARYQGPLLAAAAFAGEGFLTGGDSPSRRNVTNGLVASVAGGADLPRIELGRLRATWLATHAAALGLPALFAAAGFSHSQHVGDVVARLPVPEEAEVVRLLGAGP